MLYWQWFSTVTTWCVHSLLELGDDDAEWTLVTGDNRVMVGVSLVGLEVVGVTPLLLLGVMMFR